MRRLAIRWGAVVKPDERRVHERPTPTLGGVAMFIAFLVAMGVARLAARLRADVRVVASRSGWPSPPSSSSPSACSTTCARCRPRPRWPARCFAGVVLGLAGVMMFFFRVPFADFFVLSPDLGFLVTVLWVVGMANAVNLIDGLDGLAAGVVAIAAGAFFLYAYRLSDVGPARRPTTSRPLVVAITCGICVGFLPHNFHPAKVFMGDGGSLLLGLLMAAATISVGGRTADQFSGQTYFFFAPLFIPFVILGVPDRRHRLRHRPPGRAGGRRCRRPTRSTSTTGSCAWATASAGRCSSCGRGRRSSPASSCARPTPTRATRSCPSPWPPWPCCSTRCFHPGVRQTARQLEQEAQVDDSSVLARRRPADPTPAAATRAAVQLAATARFPVDCAPIHKRSWLHKQKGTGGAA